MTPVTAVSPDPVTRPAVWRAPLVVAVVGFCAGCWLAAAVAVPLGIGAAAALAAGAATLARRAHPARVLVVWIVLGFGLAATAHSRVAAATVEEPTSLKSEGVVGSDLGNGTQIVRLPGRRVRLLGVDTPLPLGARVSVRGTARPPPADADMARRMHYKRVAADVVGAQVTILDGPPAPLAAANAVRKSLHTAVVSALGDERGGVLLGLLDGDDSSLSQETVDDFRRGGLSHLLVVSGSNLGFVLTAVGFVLGRIPMGRRPRIVVAATVVAFYVLVTRAEPSVLRAAAMAGTAFVVSWTGELRDPVRAFATAVLALVVCDPFLAASVGFQLSAAATAGILALARPIAARLMPRVPAPIAVAIGVSTAAQVAVAPVLVWQFGRVSAVGLVANLVAVPLAGALTVAGAALSVIGWFHPPVFALLGPPVGLLVRIGSIAARAPGADLEVSRATLSGIVLVVAGVLVVLWLRRRGRTRAAAAIVAVVGLVVAGLVSGTGTAAPCPGAAFVDVGQGDATLLVGRDGATVLVDTGRDPAKLDKGLRALGVGRVDVLVLTHGDSDHVAATSTVLGNSRPALVVVPDGMTWPSDTSRATDSLVRASGVPVRTVARGDVVEAGEVRMRVLHPDPGTVARKGNDVALVGIADVAGMRVLLPSDASAEVQHRVLGDVGDVDVAKVPHHGSKDQDAALAAEARAEIAVVPVGPNSYGHPTREALDLYAGRSARQYRTDQSGTVDVCAGASPGDLRVTTSR